MNIAPCGGMMIPPSSLFDTHVSPHGNRMVVCMRKPLYKSGTPEEIRPHSIDKPGTPPNEILLSDKYRGNIKILSGNI